MTTRPSIILPHRRCQSHCSSDGWSPRRTGPQFGGQVNCTAREGAQGTGQGGRDDCRPAFPPRPGLGGSMRVVKSARDPESFCIRSDARTRPLGTGSESIGAAIWHDWAPAKSSGSFTQKTSGTAANLFWLGFCDVPQWGIAATRFCGSSSRSREVRQRSTPPGGKVITTWQRCCEAQPSSTHSRREPDGGLLGSMPRRL